MIFNLGLTKLLNFKKFLAAMEAGDYVTAGKEMLDSRWARQVGNRSDRLEQMIVNG
jgi:lysozyme